jgi:RND family efflux transporter, MFP subunit
MTRFLMITQKFWLVIVLLTLLPSCSSSSSDEKDKGNKSSSTLPPSLTSDKVAQNQIITLSEKEVLELNIKTVDVAISKHAFTVSAPGVVMPAPNYIAILSAPVDGRVISLPLNEGESVQKGQVILELESLTFGNLVAEYLQNRAEERYQSTQLQRVEQLTEKKISSEADLEKAKSEYLRALGALNASYSRLRAVGVTKTEIETFTTNDKITPKLKILSPISGVIDQHMVELGQAVSANEKLASVINLNKVLVKAYTSPEDGKYIKVGDSANVTRRLTSESPIPCTISTINPGLDENNKSLTINFMINTQDGWPKPGENVRVDIITSGNATVTSVPIVAITYEDNDPIVFVKKDDRHFEKRKIVIQEMHDNLAFVEVGLKDKDKVAITQVFSLKALARFSQFAEE